MKKLILSIVFILWLSAFGNTQTRYFEFSTNCGHGNWQDSSFVAATNDQVIIDSVLANLTRPLLQRNFISGQIDYGHGGHNHNAGHLFLWHFIPNQWNLVELAMEVCDGCPFTDVDADTAFWVGNLGQFCPWSGRPVREVSYPLLGIDDPSSTFDVSLFPNPTNSTLNVNWSGTSQLNVSIYNSIGQEILRVSIDSQNNTIDLHHLMPGVYHVKIQDGNKYVFKKLIKS